MSCDVCEPWSCYIAEMNSLSLENRRPCINTRISPGNGSTGACIDGTAVALLSIDFSQEGFVAIQDRGFASMDRTKQREIASKGGKAAHHKGSAHEWTRQEAQEAGRKGGLASHRKTDPGGGEATIEQ